MNIAEILKNVPKGIKLYSPILGDVTFKDINSLYIEVLDSSNIVREFLHNGKFYHHGECMLFPSKDNRDWSTYKSFKIGDFIVREYIGNKYIGIFSHVRKQFTVNCYCSYHCNSHTLTINPCISLGDYNKCRIATDEEKALLLNEINRKGYIWNECTLSIDKVHKFDIKELKPFDKVLVRDTNSEWKSALFYKYVSGALHPYVVSVYSLYSYCIPYNKDTEHLLGTCLDCPEYYKTW